MCTTADKISPAIDITVSKMTRKRNILQDYSSLGLGPSIFLPVYLTPSRNFLLSASMR